MNRILSVVTLAAALALATGTVALAKRHATKSAPVAAQAASVQTTGAATARCTDPAHCPFGSCPLGSKSAAVTAASTHATAKGASCSDPAKCTTACPRGNTGATAAVVTKP